MLICWPINAASSIQSGREISVIIVTDDYLCYEEPEIPYNFFLILIFNELFKFKTSTNGNIEIRRALHWTVRAYIVMKIPSLPLQRCHNVQTRKFA